MKTKLLILALVLAVTLCLTAAGLGLAAGDLDLPRWVLSGGASDSVAGDITLRATLGQPVVGVITSGGGQVTLGQGFWLGGLLSGGGYEIYLPLVLR